LKKGSLADDDNIEVACHLSVLEGIVEDDDIGRDILKGFLNEQGSLFSFFGHHHNGFGVVCCQHCRFISGISSVHKKLAPVRYKLHPFRTSAVASRNDGYPAAE